MKLNRYRDELPFGDDELRAIRAGVMKKIAGERPSRRWLGIFAAASAVAALLMVIVVRPTRVARQAQDPEVRVSVTTARVATPRESHTVVLAPLPPIHVSRRAARPRLIERIAIERITPPLASAEPVPAPMRIELQTGNPNVRILWITQPKGEPR